MTAESMRWGQFSGPACKTRLICETPKGITPYSWLIQDRQSLRECFAGLGEKLGGTVVMEPLV